MKKKLENLVKEWKKEAKDCDVEGVMTTIRGAVYERDRQILFNAHAEQLQEILKEDDSRVKEALDIIFKYSQIDGSHHKAWVIDQVVRALTGDDYDNWVKKYKEGEMYSWDEGIAP